VPFVVDYGGQRFGKYPLGWPVMLSFGERLDARAWVNPLLAGLGVWLTYRLGKKTLGEIVGLLAAGLTLTSPFFLMNSGALLSHPWGLALSAAFALSWLDAVDEQGHLPGWLPTLGAGFSLGVLALNRPLTTVGVAIPFGIHGLILIFRGSKVIRQHVFTVGAIALLVASLHFLWQFALTGDPLLSSYTLWWEYDKYGFGPGYGVTERGHSLKLAWINTLFSLKTGSSDLFGWGRLSWLFLPFGLWALRRERKTWPLVGVFPALVLLYGGYWVGAWLLGPRYYYEGLYSLTLLTAAGIAWLAGWPLRPASIITNPAWRTQSPSSRGDCRTPLRCVRNDIQQGFFRLRRLRPLLVTAVLLLLTAANVIFYLPGRIGGMYGLFGIQRARLEPFLTPEAQALTPALVFVHPEDWREYGALLELSNPFLDTPFVFVYSRGASSDAEIMAQFPERNVFHYYPEDPYRFYVERK